VVRTHNEEEARLLEAELAGKVFLGERELAQAMTRHVLERCRRGRLGRNARRKPLALPQAVTGAVSMNGVMFFIARAT
jgi:hypothetical protein